MPSELFWERLKTSITSCCSFKKCWKESCLLSTFTSTVEVESSSAITTHVEREQRFSHTFKIKIAIRAILLTRVSSSVLISYSYQESSYAFVTFVWHSHGLSDRHEATLRHSLQTLFQGHRRTGSPEQFRKVVWKVEEKTGVSAKNWKAKRWKSEEKKAESWRQETTFRLSKSAKSTTSASQGYSSRS